MPSATGSRNIYSDTYSLNTAVGTTPEINFSAGIAKAVIEIPSGSSITSLTWHSASSPGGTYIPLHNNAGTAITLTVAANKTYVLSADQITAPFVKIVANAAGSVTFTYFSTV